ncbi:HTH-like domain-containing protein [Clostridium sp. DSM 8431]|uniref:IS3 family transposase n=1 Tax=Clostridium sp. DSM 8431 TaxID=1761781 RepID=UPI0008EC8426|nr:IS3 family transposase [Clostridium sp. DSM 8431]SFU64872.1 HTH-like domain-containing protein [Clostridium sp. DSM 8431]
MFVIANDWISTGAPVGIVLRVIGLKRSTFYRWRNIESYFVKPAKAKDGIIPGFSYTFDGKRINDLVIQKYITEILNDEFGQYYGYKKVTMVLRRSKNLKISKKKVFRLMSSMNLLNKRNISPRYSKRICKNHLIKSSNILWELDTKYVYIAGTKQVAYLASIIDVFDRSIVSYELSLSPNAESAKKAVIKALFKCIDQLYKKIKNFKK